MLDTSESLCIANRPSPVTIGLAKKENSRRWDEHTEGTGQQVSTP